MAVDAEKGNEIRGELEAARSEFHEFSIAPFATDGPAEPEPELDEWPRFSDFMTFEDLFRYPVIHMRHHRAQISEP